MDDMSPEINYSPDKGFVSKPQEGEFSIEERKEYRDNLQQKVEAKLDELNNLGIDPQNADQIEANEIYQRITQAKKDDPTQSYFRLINNELLNYADNPDAKGLLIVRKLARSRDVITDAAKNLGLWEGLKNDLIKAQEIDDWEPMIGSLEDVVGQATSYGKSITRLEESEQHIPYYDFDGITEDYAKVTLLRANLTLLEAKGEGNSQESKDIRTRISLFGWGTPPPNLLRGKAEKFIRSNEKERVGEEHRKVRYYIPQYDMEVDIPEWFAVYLQSNIDTLNEQLEILEQFSGKDISFRELERRNLEKKAGKQLSGAEFEQEQFNFVRNLLDQIEGARLDWTQDQMTRERVLKLEASYGKMTGAVEREVKARLAIYDSANLMRRAKGWIKDNLSGDINISAAVITADIRGHGIDKEAIGFAISKEYRKKVNEVTPRGNLKYWEVKSGAELSFSETISMAWDLLETINSNRYRDLLETLGVSHSSLYKNGKPDVVNFFQDKDEKRRELIKTWVIEKLSKGTDIKQAKKAIQIAENLAVATMQTSRWNSQTNGGRLFSGEDMGGNDQLAECIYFRNWRLGRLADARVRGPDRSIPYIPGFGNSYLAHGDNKTRLGFTSKGSTKYMYAEATDVDKDRDFKRGPDPMLTDHINENGSFAGSDGIVAFAAVKLNRFFALKTELTNKEFKPGTITTDYLKEINVYFTDAETTFSDEQYENPFSDLRYWYVLHIVDSSLTIESGWDRDDFERLKIAVSQKDLGEPDSGTTFISQKQWDHIMKWVNFKWTLGAILTERNRQASSKRRFG